MHNLPGNEESLLENLTEHSKRIARNSFKKVSKKVVDAANWMALAILTGRGDDRVLIFTSTVTDNGIILRPSNPQLFAELEFGTLDDEGNIIQSPESVIKAMHDVLKSMR